MTLFLLISLIDPVLIPSLSILDRSRGPHGSMIPNDYYASETSAFQIIQGPNMSGKTTYITSIGLMVIFTTPTFSINSDPLL